MKTLQEARDELYTAVRNKSQATCPCCNRLVKVYRRTLNASQARYLIEMARKSGAGNPWLHVETDFRDVSTPARGDYAKLRFWGLIEPRPAHKGRGGKTNGYWRLTDRGRTFVAGQSFVPAYIFLLDNLVIGSAAKLVDIKQALGTKFNYDELMNATFKEL